MNAFRGVVANHPAHTVRAEKPGDRAGRNGKGFGAGVGISIGAGLGTVLGLLLLDDWWLGSAIGVAVGLIIGSIVDTWSSRKTTLPD